jgi:hypothetical protein
MAEADKRYVADKARQQTRPLTAPQRMSAARDPGPAVDAVDRIRG